MKKFNLLILLFILFISCSNGNSTGSTNIAKNFQLPALTDNETYKLTQFQGKPVIINFWASWCAPCLQEMPFLENIWKENKAKSLVLLGINVLDDKKEAKETLRELGISYLNLYDPDGKIKEMYNLMALPATYFIDSEGKITKINYGPFLGKEGEDLFNTLLQDILK